MDLDRISEHATRFGEQKRASGEREGDQEREQGGGQGLTVLLTFVFMDSK